MVFFDPRKWNPVEKRLALGGILSSIVAHAERAAQWAVPGFPPELSQRLDPNLPTNGELIATVAPPATLYITKRIAKSGTTKEKLADIGFGSALFSFPYLMARVGSQVAYNQGVAIRPLRLTTPIPATKYTQTATPARPTVAPTIGKYRLTA